MNTVDTTAQSDEALPPGIWKRLGVAGFLFFLVKGLLWLAAPAIIYLLA